ncbi:MAG: Ig-like domain-containing protein [Fibrobacterales bacterium]
MKIYLSVLFFLFLIVISCDLFNEGNISRDYIVSIHTTKSISVDSIVVTKVIDEDTTVMVFNKSDIKSTPDTESGGEILEVSFSIMAENSAQIQVSYLCYSEGFVIIHKVSHFQLSDDNPLTSSYVDTLLVSLLEEYNNKKIVNDSLVDSVAIDSVKQLNSSIFHTITVNYMLAVDSSSIASQKFYSAYKKHTLLINDGDSSKVDTLSLFRDIRDSIIVNGLPVDSTMAMILPPGLSVAQILSELPAPLVKPNEPNGRFVFKGSIVSHAEDVARIDLLVSSKDSTDPVSIVAVYDSLTNEYSGFLDVYILKDSYSIDVMVYNSNKHLTGYWQKEFSSSTFNLSIAPIDAWNAKPWVAIDSIADYSINDRILPGFQAKDSLGSEGPISIMWKHGAGEYVRQTDSTFRITLPEILSLSYPVYIKVIDSDSNIAIDSIFLNVLQDVPVAIAGDSIITAVNTAVSFKGGATQDFGEINMYKWDFNGDGVFEDSSMVDTTYSYTYCYSGEYVARYWVMDDDGNYATDSLIVTVINSAPVIDSLSSDTLLSLTDVTITKDDSLFVVTKYSDTEGNLYLVEFDGNGDSVFESVDSLANAATGVSRFYYHYQKAGTYTVVIRVTDFDGKSVSKSLSVRVNTLPQIKTTTFEIDENSKSSFGPIISTDADGDLVQISVLSEYFTYSESTGMLTPAEKFDFETDSTHFIPIVAFDGIDSVFSQITVTIINLNDNKPVIVQDSVYTVNTKEDKIKTLTLTVSDADNDYSNLLWSIKKGFTASNGTVTGVLGSGKSKNINYIPKEDFNGLDSFVVVVTNESFVDEILIYVSISDQDDPANYTGTPVITGNKKVASPLTITNGDCYDTDDDVITWEYYWYRTVNRDSVGVLIGGANKSLYTLVAKDGGNFIYAQVMCNGVPKITAVSSEINAAPVIKNGDTYPIELNEDVPYEFSLEVEDVNDPNGEGILWSVSVSPSLGEVDMSATGNSRTIIYSPLANVVGKDSFDITVNDGELIDKITVNVTINPLGDKPVINKSTIKTIDVVEDALSGSSVTLQASDGDNDVLTWSIVTEAAKGTAQVSGDKSNSQVVSYTPFADEYGADAFSVQVSDSKGGTDVVSVPVNISPKNDQPIITESNLTAISVKEDASGFVIITLHAFDIDGDVLSWEIESPATKGEVSVVSGTGSSQGITYKPLHNAVGADVFTVKVSDGYNGSDEISVPVIITPVNDAPEIEEPNVLIISIGEDDPNAVISHLHANDEDGDALKWAIKSHAQKGSAAVLSGNGDQQDISYKPATNASGLDEFIVEVFDGNGGFDEIIIQVNISSVEDAPLITDKNVPPIEVLEDALEAGKAVLHASDGDGDALNWIIKEVAVKGIATVASGVGNSQEISYIPGKNSNGTDSFIVEVSDMNGNKDAVTISVNITSINDAPTIDGSNVVTVNIDEDALKTVIAELGASDVDDDNLSWYISLQALKGEAAVEGTGQGVVQKISYKPAVNKNGSDNFSVRVSDRKGGNAEVNVTVNIIPKEDAPVIADIQTIEVDEDSSVEFNINAVDADGDVISWRILSGPDVDKGTVTGVEGVGEIKNVTYTPKPDYNGSDSFVVEVESNNGLKDQATVTVNVKSVNDAPFFTEENDTLSVLEDTTVSYSPVVIDIDSDLATMNWRILSEPSSGNVSINSSPLITYVPDVNFNGTDEFVVKVTDDMGAYDIQRVHVKVVSVNDPPIIIGDIVITGKAISGYSLQFGTNVSCVDENDFETNSLPIEYEWYRDDAATGDNGEKLSVSGNSYQVTDLDTNKYIYGKISCTDEGGEVAVSQKTEHTARITSYIETFIDKRDGQVYKKILIGTQEWMAENLNYRTHNGFDPDSGSYCYDADSENCEKYGRLYDWHSAMDSSAASDVSPSGVNGICPEGWHIPSDGEWSVLNDFLISEEESGDALRASHGWNAPGTDKYRFSALAAGIRNWHSYLYLYGGEVYFTAYWSSTEVVGNDTSSIAWILEWRNIDTQVRLKIWGLSVRCVRD